MTKSVTELRAIAGTGGGLIIDASGFTATELRSIAGSAKGTGATITLKGADSLSTTELRAIASAGGGAVVFDFS